MKYKKTSAAVFGSCLSALLGFEGLYLKPYRDIAGVLTVCIGETDTDKVEGSPTYTVQQCKDMLAKVLVRYDDGMKACLSREITDGMHVAFLSTTYNIGIQGFCGSSMARRANAGDFPGACDALLLWNKARTSTGFRVVKGLDTRRKAERKICREGLPE